MKKRLTFFIFALTAVLFAGLAHAQIDPLGYAALLPANPTSVDNLKLSLRGRTCGGTNRYSANSYRVSMSQNNITVTVGERVSYIEPLCPPTARDEVDLGRLPAGNYTLTVIDVKSMGAANPFFGDFSNAPFTVSDARLLKTAPYVRLDYSGHWWDPNDPGWGLFIWHDALDRVLAAWFTYGTDGKPIWYVFQPTWQTFAATVTADLLRTSRPPGTTIPPPNPTTYTVAGSASLDFTHLDGGTELAAVEADQGKFTYSFTGGPTTVRNIKRFKP